MPSVGVVAIGRNEGERLRQCLLSVQAAGCPAVYVDSGSTDASVATACALGAEVVELDTSVPFSAARARNAGFDRLLSRWPGLQFVQFVDGDCELVAGWLPRAVDAFSARADLAVVCGRRRERFPEASIYNRLCDTEWDTPPGEAETCGGDALFRVSAFQAVGGFNPAVIAGEEPELCLRLRRAGWRILRIDAEMTLHDARMTTFGQWWKRNVRAGYAYALGAAMHGGSPDRHWVRPSRSIWCWGLVLPLLAVAPAWWTRGWSLLLLAAYPALTARIYAGLRRRGFVSLEAWEYALFTAFSKFPKLAGQVRYLADRLRKAQARIIEYKSPQPEVSALPERATASSGR